MSHRAGVQRIVTDQESVAMRMLFTHGCVMDWQLLPGYPGVRYVYAAHGQHRDTGVGVQAVLQVQEQSSWLQVLVGHARAVVALPCTAARMVVFEADVHQLLHGGAT